MLELPGEGDTGLRSAGGWRVGGESSNTAPFEVSIPIYGFGDTKKRDFVYILLDEKNRVKPGLYFQKEREHW